MSKCLLLLIGLCVFSPRILSAQHFPTAPVKIEVVPLRVAVWISSPEPSPSGSPRFWASPCWSAIVPAREAL